MDTMDSTDACFELLIVTPFISLFLLITGVTLKSLKVTSVESVTGIRGAFLLPYLIQSQLFLFPAGARY